MPRWGDEPVTFDKFDTLHSAMGKLDQAGSGWPFVVLASNCRLADNVLLYRLLARASERFGAPIAVVASNPYWRRLAREHGLSAYGSVGSLRRARRRSLISVPERLLDAIFSSLHVSMSKEASVIVVVVLAVAAAAAFLFVPVMRVTIHAPVETLNRDLLVRVDVAASAADVTSATIPGRTMEHRFSVSDFVETTGDKKVGKERARGDVTIINPSPGLVVLPAGTVLSTASGERFATTVLASIGPFGQDGSPSAILPPGATPSPTARPATATPVPRATLGATPVPSPVSGVIVRVPVQAVEPGVKGNVPALAVSRIEGDAFRGLTVFNEQAFAGGTEAKTRSASADDRSRLKEALFQKVQSQGLSELTLRVRQSESLIPHSMQVRIDREEYDKAQDEEAERLGGTMYVMATGIAFANQDLNSLVERAWRSTAPKGYRALPGALNVAPPEVIEAGASTAGLRVKVDGKVERVLEADDLAQSLRGMAVQDAKSKLSQLESPLRLQSLEIWPEWAPRAYRIEVQTVQ